MADAIDINTLVGASATEIDGVSGADMALGLAVANVGDINGDGIDDLVITNWGQRNGYASGGAMVVFGKAGGLGATFDPASLNGTNGFLINGVGANSFAGTAVAGGDLNGDGYADIVLADRAPDRSGNVYVIYGKAGGWAASMDVTALNGPNGFTVRGAAPGAYAGVDVDVVHDVNGDGIDDLLLGAWRESPSGLSGYQVGAAYVIYGHKDAGPESVYLSALNGSTGFRIHGAQDYMEQFGLKVAGLDFNGDGLEDLASLAFGGNGAGRTFNGVAYITFGSAGGFGDSVDAAAQADGVHGVAIAGPEGGDYLLDMNSAGDVNGDGVDDLLIGAWMTSPNGVSQAGGSYLVFGARSGLPPVIDLAHLDGSNGFAVPGVSAYGYAGVVAGIGDVNGDGVDDFAVSAAYASGSAEYQGEVYVIYGHKGAWGASFDLTTLDGTNGYRLAGHGAYDNLGMGLSGVGDVNGDGFDDFFVGATGMNKGTGGGYLVYGGPPGKPKGETYVGGAGNDLHNGTSGDDTLSGLGGKDVLNGLGGDDLLSGGDGNDILSGGIGKDTLVGGAGDDSLDGGDDNDTLDGGDGLDKLFGGAGDDTLSGGAGADKLDGGDGADSLTGGDGADTLTGGSGIDLLSGGADNDYLDGGAGADVMAGGGGNDTYLVDDAGDVVTELANEGSDVVRASVSWTMTANIETLQLQGTADLSGTGNDQANNITGNDGANVLNGGAGGDTLSGGAGNDSLIGGVGNDTLTGGLGADTFVIQAVSVGSSKLKTVIETDNVTDYSQAQGDRLDLSAIDADLNTNGDQAFHLVGTFGKHAGEMTLAYTAANNTTLLKLDVDGDGVADYQLKFAGDTHLASGGWIL